MLTTILAVVFLPVALGAIGWALSLQGKLEPLRGEVARLRAEVHELERKRDGRKDKDQDHWKRAEASEKEARRAEGRADKEARRAETAEQARARIEGELKEVRRELKEHRQAAADAQAALQGARREAEAEKKRALDEVAAGKAQTEAAIARVRDEAARAAAAGGPAAPPVDLDLLEARHNARVGELGLELEGVRLLVKRDGDRARAAEQRLRELAGDLLEAERRRRIQEKLQVSHWKLAMMMRGKLEIALDLLGQFREKHGSPFPEDLTIPETAYGEEPLLEPVADDLEEAWHQKHPEAGRRPAPALANGEIDEVDVVFREERIAEARELQKAWEARQEERRREADERRAEAERRRAETRGARDAVAAPVEARVPPPNGGPTASASDSNGPVQDSESTGRAPERRIARVAATAAVPRPEAKAPRPAATPSRTTETKPARETARGNKAGARTPSAPAVAAPAAPIPEVDPVASEGPVAVASTEEAAPVGRAPETGEGAVPAADSEPTPLSTEPSRAAAAPGDGPETPAEALAPGHDPQDAGAREVPLAAELPEPEALG